MIGEVPAAVVTRTSTVAALCVGLVTVSDVAVLAVMDPATAPKLTEVALATLVPVMVTVAPPAVGPDVGLTLDTAGATT